MLEPIKSLHEAEEGYGGKASGLHWLFSNGFPVPDGIALSPGFVSNIHTQPLNKENQQLLNVFLHGKEKIQFAVRSSALNEDGEENSFAGIYDTMLNVPGNYVEIVSAINKVYQSQYSSRVDSYNSERQIGIVDSSQIGIIIQEMIKPNIAGVAFTSAISLNGQSILLLECVSGLGDKLVSGLVTPTRIEIPIDTNGHAEIAKCIVNGQPQNLNGLPRLVELLTSCSQKAKYPLDIEWAIDEKENPWLLQARPVTKKVFVPNNNNDAVAASSGIAKGLAYVIEAEEELNEFPPGAIMIAKVTETNYLPAMRKASAIITEEGGILSHAAIVSREIGIPCIVGCSNARKYFPTGSKLVVDGTSGTITIEKDSNISSVANIKKQDVDWGAAYLFELLLPIEINKTIGLFNPTPTGLALHLPDDIEPVVNEEFELFSRRTFGQSPRRYQSDKYLWYFEWQRFLNLEFFRDNLHKSQQIINLIDADLLVEHYETILKKSIQLVALNQETKSSSLKFLLDEMLLTSHFLLTMLIPEGYALKTIYSKSKGLLDKYVFSFSDLLKGDLNNLPADKDIQKIAKFSQTASTLRNGIYDKLVEAKIMREDYFEDRENRAKNAIISMKVDSSDEDDPVSLFYSNIHLAEKPN